MPNIANAFDTNNFSVYEYFQRPGVGFYIPLYQREYSWDNENIDQLLEDIAKGLDNLLEPDPKEIRFLGTVITVTENDKNKIQPQDTRALPTSIEKVIDGQQRLSTIAMFATILYQHISALEDRLINANNNSGINPNEFNDIKISINEACNSWKGKLIDIFSLDLKRGNPIRKPKIIRGNQDKWVLEETANTSYKSHIAKYLFEYIGTLNGSPQLPKFDKSHKVGMNLQTIDRWIKSIVLKAHTSNNNFPSAYSILKQLNQENIWQYKRNNLETFIKTNPEDDENQFEYKLNSLVQIFAVSHYLLERCCFTAIQPVSDDWAFDMFQSLNATGTPLTAIETFKPLVVNTVENSRRDFKSSEESRYFSKIDKAFEDLKTAAQKSKHTNELLTSFAVIVTGEKLSSHFSAQRKWLEKVYGRLDDERKRSVIKLLGNHSEFYKTVWLNYKGNNNLPLNTISQSPESELASLLLLFLNESNHRMSITALANSYYNVIEGKQDSIKEFIDSVKLVSSFYILWRSCKTNSGLDDVYRTYFKGSEKLKASGKCWEKSGILDIVDFKTYLCDVLKKEELVEKKLWINNAQAFLGYDTSTTVCKITLFISAHDTIPDDSNKGLMKKGTNNCAPFLKLENWLSNDLETIEHIAPEKQTIGWSEKLYDERNLFHSIGNLTLLPLDINASIGNKDWKEKLLYYKHLSEKDPSKQQELTNKAKAEGISLKSEAINLLKNANYRSHIAHLTKLDDSFNWNDEFVKKRAERILSLTWDVISSWILK